MYDESIGPRASPANHFHRRPCNVYRYECQGLHFGPNINIMNSPARVLQVTIKMSSNCAAQITPNFTGSYRLRVPYPNRSILIKAIFLTQDRRTDKVAVGITYVFGFGQNAVRVISTQSPSGDRQRSLAWMRTWYVPVSVPSHLAS